MKLTYKGKRKPKPRDPESVEARMRQQLDECGLDVPDWMVRELLDLRTLIFKDVYPTAVPYFDVYHVFDFECETDAEREAFRVDED